MRTTAGKVARVGFFGVSGLALGVVATIILLLVLLFVILGVKALLAKSPTQRAKGEVQTLYTTSTRRRTAVVISCRQIGKDPQGLFFRCGVQASKCVRSFVFYEEPDSFSGYQLSLWSAPDRALANPCDVPNDPAMVRFP